MRPTDREELLAHALRETLWMARRYADLRQTYAPGMFNDALEALLRAGEYDIVARAVDNSPLPDYDSPHQRREATVWAEDGDKALRPCPQAARYGDMPVERTGDAFAPTARARAALGLTSQIATSKETEA
jgi:hypothetical protein